MDQTLLDVFKEMVNHCQALNNILMLDQDHFSKNKIQALNDSSEEKMNLIDKIHDNIKTINAIFAQQDKSLNVSNLKELMNSLDNNNKTLAYSLLNKLCSIAKECNERILVNNQVISFNTMQLQNLWNGLLSCKTKDNNMYSQYGTML